ncbi:MAG: pyridoxamine 5'-phosphate oxidase family protein [Syntrophales bacterium]|jgi:nitroimidazol reductase NimA-like FMN-containing flavoprotein (pyridoxamine 5'-phosphate oxidase superfamily)
MKREKVPNTTRKGAVIIPERLKLLDRMEYFAVLATDSDGQPYTSLINFALMPDYKTVIFATPRATKKYRNMIKTKSVALLIDSRPKKTKNLMGTEAVTVIGNARPLKRGKAWETFANIYIKKHPDLAEFIYSLSTSLMVVDATRCIHVSQFQTISVWDCGQ